MSERNRNIISKIMQDFNTGESVSIDINPSVEGGMPFRRFNGLQGTVVEKQGRCYLVKVRCGNKMKKVLSSPAHLKRM
jgi:large subunit ribosomal protein L21e